ncbi:Endoribonuclease L-PSP/chorismate mutase-like protein [Lasiosphaeris hirsuta]|uniref:Endoribonuclease L-PSP/chorismate mutase-like protein n=1 Tax=Lasiosphaeris hirsuta TaxID=260670 RepID=A0AA40DWZ9_9PEZI|nr:Endoribonuclease L-PSP/chorismate mutase-like protein [Lasiosphaeris hirsuta]
MVERTLISSGSAFEAQIGYSRAVISGDLIFVSGCTGYDYKTSTLPPTVTAQTEQCMLNISTALSAAGASIADVVRVRYIRKNDFPPTFPILRKWLGTVRPAATMLQAGLMEEAMLIEIEVTAVRRPAGKAEIDERGGFETVLL